VGVPSVVQGVPGDLKAALLNLAVNARDAMPQGGAITIGARSEWVGPDLTVPGLEPGPYVCLSIADQGIGMDEATVARATEPFFTTKGVGKGTGLGLSMVAGLASQSGGVLRLISRVGQGTTVELWLCRAGAVSVEPSEAQSTPRLSPEVRRSLVVLLVDDDALVAMGTAAMHEEMGHAVLTAASGEQALAVLRSGAHVDLAGC